MADVINALFEAGASIFILLSVRRIFRDKAVAGVSWLTIAFFFSWGLWNLVHYYPGLGQWWSTAAAGLVVVANGTWIYGLLKYRRK